MKRRLVLLLALAVLSGCGSNGGDDESAAPAGGAQIEIGETEFALDPENPTVGAAGETTIRVVNNGEVPHALEVEGDGIEVETGSIAPGEAAELIVELREGEYEVYCPIGDHRAEGMEGTLVVGSEAAGGTGTGTGEEEDEGEDEGSRYDG